MPALSPVRIRRRVRPLLGSLALLLALALLSASFGNTLRSVHAQDTTPNVPQAVFPGTGVGAIGDGGVGTSA